MAGAGKETIQETQCTCEDADQHTESVNYWPAEQDKAWLAETISF